MKKITAILALVATLFISGAVYAGDDRPVTVEQLPAAAQQFIQKYFPGVGVSYAKMDKELMNTTYDVIFVDGRKVEFLKDGNWKEVDCKHAEVPAGIVPAQIHTYVQKSYPGQTIVKVERDRKGYELKMKSGLELNFDKSFKLVGIDD